MEDEGLLTANCHLLAGYIAGGVPRDGFYQIDGFEPKEGRLVVKSRNGNLYTVTVRQIAGTE